MYWQIIKMGLDYGYLRIRVSRSGLKGMYTCICAACMGQVSKSLAMGVAFPTNTLLY